MWKVWDERYGQRYYHFIYKNVLFLVLDTEDNPPDIQQQIFDVRAEAMRIVAVQGWGVFEETGYGQLTERKSGRIGEQQAAYFRQVIAQNPQVRWTFLLMHKPAWERPAEEHFSTIEAALAGTPHTPRSTATFIPTCMSSATTGTTSAWPPPAAFRTPTRKWPSTTSRW